MKVFISQPMKGRTATEIQQERKEALKKVQELFPNKTVEELWTHYKEESKSPLFHLGKSIQEMGKADLVIFVEGWQNARGCCVEMTAVCAYKLPAMRLDEDEKPWIFEDTAVECEVQH